MDKSLRQPIRQTSCAMEGPEDFYKAYENQFNCANIPFRYSVDSSTRAEATLYRVLLPHGKVDQLTDLDPYNIQSFYDQSRKEEEKKQASRLSTKPVVFQAVFSSPPKTHASGPYHDAYKQALRPPAARAATLPRLPQLKASRATIHRHPAQTESKPSYQGPHYALPGQTHSRTSDSAVTVYEDNEDDIETNEETVNDEEMLDSGMVSPIGKLGQQVNCQAPNSLLSSNNTKAKKRISISQRQYTQPNLKRIWTDAEHVAVLQELQILRAEETRRVARKN